MKKFLGFVIITSFACSYAMESEEVKTLSIVNQSPKTLILKIKLKKQKAYRRCLAPRDCKDFFVIKNPDELKRIEVGINGTTGFKTLELKDKTSYTHSLLVLNIPNEQLETLGALQNDPQHWQTAWTWNFSNEILCDGSFLLEKPMGMEYPGISGPPILYIMDIIRYFPGVYNYARTNYLGSRFYGQINSIDLIKNIDSIPPTYWLSVPAHYNTEDVERAYAELCKIWNPGRFDNPRQQIFAQRAMDVLKKKYESLSQ
jgi:hypothetical protein